MDRNLWIRIQTTGAQQAGAAVRGVGQAMRAVAADVRVSSAQIRLASQVTADSITKNFDRVPQGLRRARSAIATESRFIAGRMGQIFGATGALNRPGQGGQFAQGIQQMAMSTRLGLAAITGHVSQANRTITGALRDWGAQAQASGQRFSSALARAGQSARSATRDWATQAQALGSRAFQTLGVHARFFGDIAKQGFDRASVALRGYGSRLFELGRDQEQASHAIGIAFASIGAAIIGTFALSVREAARFQEEMQNVASVFAGERGLSSMMAEFNTQILELSSRLPQSPHQLAIGLYEVAQAGFTGASAFQVLEAAATAASAGLTDTVTSARGLMAVINAYGESTKRADYISDVLFQTVKVGIISFEELSQQIGDFVGFAAAAGIKIEDLGIAMATMTRAGIPAAEAATSLNRVIQAFVKPSQDMKRVMDQVGISVTDFKDGTLDLPQAMEVLRHATGGNVVEIQKLFREIRAARGAYALMADDGKLLAEVQREFGDSTKINNQTLRALSEQSKSLNFQWKITRNEFTQSAIEIGNKLLPALTSMAQTLQSVMQAWQDLPGPVKNVVLVLGSVVGLASAMAGAMFLLLPRIADMARAMETLGLASEATAAKIGRITKVAGWVGLALAALGVAYTLFRGSQDDATKSVEEFSSAVQENGKIMDSANTKALAKDIASSGLDEAFDDIGVSSGRAIDAIQGVDGASADLADQFKAASRAISGFNIPDSAFADLKRGLDGNAPAMNRFLSQARELQRVMENPESGQGFTEEQISRNAELIRVLTYVNTQRQAGIKALQVYNSTQEAGNKTSATATANLLGMGDATEDLVAQDGKLTDEQKALNELFSDIVSPANAYKDATDALKPLTTLTGVYSDALSEAQAKLNEQASVLNESHNKSLTAAAQAAADAARNSKRSADDTAKSVTRIKGANDAVKNSARDSATAQKRAAEDAARSVARSTSEQRTKVSDYQREARLSINQYIAALNDSVKKQQTYYTNINTLTRRGFGGLVDAIADGSEESANLLQVLAQGTDEQIRKVERSYKRLGPSADTSFKEFMRQLEKRQRNLERVNENTYKLVARGQSQLVDAIMSSNLDPQAQADLINQAAGQNDKALTHLYNLLSTANAQGSDLFAVSADKNVRIVAAMVDQMGQEANSFTLQQLYDEFKRTNQDVQISKEEFITALSSMGDAINDLPKNVQTQVHAYVTGTQQIAALNTQIDQFIKKTENLPAQVRKNVRGMGLNELNDRLGEAQRVVNGTVPAKTVSINATSVTINTARGPAMHARAEGGVDLPKNAKIQAPTKTLVQWAEPETGGEAFIPLAHSKRARSLDILGEVADIFGYGLIKHAADGAIESRAWGGMTPGGRMGVAPRSYTASYAGGPGGGGGGSRNERVVEHRTHSQPVYIDKVEARDYSDFLRQLDLQSSFHSMPGNGG